MCSYPKFTLVKFLSDIGGILWDLILYLLSTRLTSQSTLWAPSSFDVLMWHQVQNWLWCLLFSRYWGCHRSTPLCGIISEYSRPEFHTRPSLEARCIFNLRWSPDSGGDPWFTCCRDLNTCASMKKIDGMDRIDAPEKSRQFLIHCRRRI